MTNLRRVPTQPELWCSEEGQVFRQWETEMRPLKAQRLKNGYAAVSTTFQGKHKTLYVHHLVCAAFHGPKPTPKAIVLHGDGDKLNNTSQNVRWGTYKDNQRDQKRHGRALTGEKNPAAKLNRMTAFAAKEAVLMGLSRRVVAERYGVSVFTLGALVRGETWNEEPGEVATCA